MRLPKNVKIGGKLYCVRRNRKLGSAYGRVNCVKKAMEIGIGEDQEVFDTYVHEIAEAALIENCFRFNRNGQEDFVYQMNHTEFDRFIGDVACAIFPMIKK